MIFTVPMWGSEVANSKTEIHITNTASEVMWLCNVTTIEHEEERCRFMERPMKNPMVYR